MEKTSMLPKNIWIIIILGLVVVTGLVVWGMQEGKGEEAASSGITYYYGEGCPHCKVISEFLEANKIAEKVDFTKKEVWANKTNAREMDKRAKACNLAPSETGVPFVYDGSDGKCYVGEPDVKGFFSKKAGLETETKQPENKE